jgi:hypothetical protein
MPTSSQSQILSVVDYQLLQQASGQNGTTKPPLRISVNQTSINESKRRHQNGDRRRSIENKTDEDNHSPPPPPSNVFNRRQSSDKNNDSKI